MERNSLKTLKICRSKPWLVGWFIGWSIGCLIGYFIGQIVTLFGDFGYHTGDFGRLFGHF